MFSGTRERGAHCSIDDGVLAAEEECRLVRICRIRYLLVPQRVRGPLANSVSSHNTQRRAGGAHVEVALYDVRNAEFGADKVAHDELDALGVCAGEFRCIRMKTRDECILCDKVGRRSCSIHLVMGHEWRL